MKKRKASLWNLRGWINLKPVKVKVNLRHGSDRILGYKVRGTKALYLTRRYSLPWDGWAVTDSVSGFTIGECMPCPLQALRTAHFISLLVYECQQDGGWPRNEKGEGITAEALTFLELERAWLGLDA